MFHHTRQTFRRGTAALAVPRLIGTGIEVTDEAVWTWALIPASSTYLREEDDLVHATWEATTALTTILHPGAQFHLKVLWSRYDPADYTTGWQAVHSVMAPGADDYIALGERRIRRNADDGYFRRRVVLLGMRWSDPEDPRTQGSTWDRARLVARQAARRNLQTRAAAHRDARARYARVRPQIERWFTQLARSALAGIPAPAGTIAWAYAKEFRRTNLTMATTDTLAGPALVNLCHGTIDPRPARPADHVIVTDGETGQQRYVSVLAAAVNGFSTELEVPGGEWLEILTELPGVEASVRGICHGQAGSIALLDHGRKLSGSQAREAALQGAQVPLEVLDADDTLTTRRQEVQRRQDVMTTTHPRWIVDAEGLDELRERIAHVQERYSGIVHLEPVPDVQGLLWSELLPGDQTRVPEFAQHQPLRTLAGSWFHGGSAVGDTTGPYIGANLGSTPGPVQLHLVSRADDDRTRPTTVTCTGRSGSGKSTAVMLFVLGALCEGAWSLLVDPKGDLHGIVDLAARLLGVPIQVIDVLDPAASGTMDPMRTSATADLARTLTLDAMLGALSPADRRRGETAIENAIDAVLRFPRDAWSAHAVINDLRTTPTRSRDPETATRAAEGKNSGSVAEPRPAYTGRGELARELGDILALRAKQPQMRAVLGPLADHAQPLMTGRGLVYLGLAGLDLPRHNPDPDRWTIAERCSITTFRVSLSYALGVARTVRSMKKVVALTELHVLTRHPEGRAMVEWLARTGRAYQTWLLLDTQAAVDLAKITGLTEQIVMGLAFRSDGSDEQDAQAALLKRADPGPRLRHMLTTLDTGDCVVLDRHGRIAPVHWDLMSEQIRDALSTDAAEDTDTTGNVGNMDTETSSAGEGDQP